MLVEHFVTIKFKAVKNKYTKHYYSECVGIFICFKAGSYYTKCISSNSLRNTEFNQFIRGELRWKFDPRKLIKILWVFAPIMNKIEYGDMRAF